MSGWLPRRAQTSTSENGSLPSPASPTTPFPVEELGWAVRRFFEHLGAQGPLVVVIDDVHWAEPLLLELVEQLVATIRDRPVLFVVTARPVLLEEHESFATGLPEVRVVLAPLSGEDTGRFVSEVLGAAGVDPAVTAAVAAASGGNPVCRATPVDARRGRPARGGGRSVVLRAGAQRSGCPLRSRRSWLLGSTLSRPTSARSSDPRRS